MPTGETFTKPVETPAPERVPEPQAPLGLDAAAFASGTGNAAMARWAASVSFGATLAPPREPAPPPAADLAVASGLADAARARNGGGGTAAAAAEAVSGAAETLGWAAAGAAEALSGAIAGAANGAAPTLLEPAKPPDASFSAPAAEETAGRPGPAETPAKGAASSPAATTAQAAASPPAITPGAPSPAASSPAATTAQATASPPAITPGAPSPAASSPPAPTDAISPPAPSGAASSPPVAAATASPPAVAGAAGDPPSIAAPPAPAGGADARASGGPAASPHAAAGAAPHSPAGAAAHHAGASPHSPAGFHRSSPRGASAGPKAAAAPIAEAGGSVDSPELDAWKAAVDSAKGEIAGPKLDHVAAAPATLAGQAAATEQQRAGERPDYAAEARGTLPPDPKGPPPAEQLDTAKADAAVAAVDAAGKAKLSNQALPPMVAIPGELIPPKAPSVALPVQAEGPVTALPNAPGRPDPKADAVQGRIAAVGPVQAGLGPAGPAIAQDPGPASLDPLPPAQATQIGDVAARVLADAPKHAQGILDEAAAALDPGKRVSAYETLVKDRFDAELAGLTTELKGVAAAAGVSAEDLQAKVAAKQAQAAQLHATADAQLDEHAAAGTDAVKQRGEQEQQQIGGASAAVREEVDRKLQAAKGTADPAVVNARRDTYLQKTADSAAAGSARLRAAKERRTADLQKLAGDQKAAYRRQAQTEAAKAEGQDATAKKIAARPLLDWSDKQALEVDGHVARLTREAGEEVERLETAITEAAAGAKEQIRDWAVEKQGRQRSWWDRLMDVISDYVDQAKADNKAWEAQRNAETRDKVASDLTKLAKLRDDMKAGNRDAVLAEMARMSNQERAVVQAFLQSGGKDAIGAVAAGMVARIKGHRVPELSQKLEEAAIATLPWEQLNLLGMTQTPGFDAGLLAREVRGSVKGIGTNEKRLFKALEGHTKLQTAAMRKAYAAIYDGRDMDEDIDDDVSGSEQERADALRSGDPTAAAIATLNDAMDGAGTDEKLIMQTLRGKTPAERDAIIAAYEKKYGHPLKSDLKSEMGGYELGQADALLEGDTVKADAMALKDAMDGAGTDEPEIQAVYARIRDEVEGEAVAKGMKTAEVEAEIKRRTGELKRTYDTSFDATLEDDFRSEMSGGELNLALAAQNVDQSAMDAATLQIEHESAWTSDEKVNDVLKGQYTRAQKEVMRDLTIDFNEQSRTMSRAERKAAWEQVKKQGETMALARSKQYMGDLKAQYDKTAVLTDFDSLISNEVSGYDQDEARDRIAGGGKLSDEKELKYAIYGVGTKEQVIKDVLKGKSKEEIRQLKLLYAAETDGGDLIEDLEGDLSGRDEADALAVMETGDSSLEEKLALLKRRKAWELGEGTGDAGGAFLGEEEKVLKATTEEAEAAYAEYSKFESLPDDDPQKIAAKERLERWLGYGDKDIDRHREELDSVTDTIALVGGIAVGIAVTVLTAGAAGPAVAAAAAALGTSTTVVAAAAGAIAAVAVSMTVKQEMKGDAYGGEDIAIDLAQGTADALVAVATAGMGEAALKALSRVPALAAIARAAEGGVLKRMAYKGVEGSLEGMISGLPSGMMAAILDENTWKSGNPFKVIMEAGGSGAAQGAKMGGAMGGGMEGAGTAVKGIRAPTHAEPVHASGGGEAPHEPTIHEGPGAVEDPTPLDHPDAPHIEESPPGGWEPTGPEPAPEPDYDPGPPEEIEVENLPDAEAPEIHESPPGGYPLEGPGPAPEPEWHPAEPPEEIQIESTPPIDEQPVGVRSHDDEPTGVHEDSPTGEFDAVTREWEIPEIELPPDTVMYHDRGLTPVEANRMYESSIMGSNGLREVMVLENTVTGERVVVQGTRNRARTGTAEWAEFMADGGSRGDWRVVRHYHPVGPGGVTPPLNRYPSGMGGDMTGVRSRALRDGQMHVETLDIRTELGREQVKFGYVPGTPEPYFISIDRPGGAGTEFHTFENLERYHEFVEQRTGQHPEPIGRPTGDNTRHSSPDDFDDAPTGEFERELPVHERPTKPMPAVTPEQVAHLDPDEAFHLLADERVLRAELDQLLLELGQPPLTRSEVSPAEAMDLHEFLANLRFVDAAGAEAPVPYHYPVDGCWGRAHMMAEAMAKMGIESERVFATSTVRGEPLRVQSDFSQDQPGHRPPVTDWFYHVAPIVKVRTPAGIEYFVIDPSTQSTAVPVREWLATMGVAPGSYRQMTHQELMAHLAADHPGPREHGFPQNERLVWTTDRNTMYPSDPPAPDSSRSHAQYQGAHGQLSNYAQRAAVSEVAAALRQELRRPGATAASVIAVIRRGQPWSQWLQSGFGMLHAELMNRFKADQAAIEEALKP